MSDIKEDIWQIRNITSKSFTWQNYHLPVQLKLHFDRAEMSQHWPKVSDTESSFGWVLRRTAGSRDGTVIKQEIMTPRGSYRHFEGFCCTHGHLPGKWCKSSSAGSSKHIYVDPVLVWGWPTVYDAGPTLKQHWLNVSCLQGSWPSCISVCWTMSKILQRKGKCFQMCDEEIMYAEAWFWESKNALNL